MLLRLAEHIRGAASGRPKLGRRPMGNSLYAPLVLKALASASIKSIGHPLVLKALCNYLFLKRRQLLGLNNFNCYLQSFPTYLDVG